MLRIKLFKNQLILIIDPKWLATTRSLWNLMSVFCALCFIVCRTLLCGAPPARLWSRDAEHCRPPRAGFPSRWTEHEDGWLSWVSECFWRSLQGFFGENISPFHQNNSFDLHFEVILPAPCHTLEKGVGGLELQADSQSPLCVFFSSENSRWQSLSACICTFVCRLPFWFQLLLHACSTATLIGMVMLMRLGPDVKKMHLYF